MTWNSRAIRAIVWKDLKQVFQNKMVWLPMVLVPIILQVLMPLMMVLMPTFVGIDELGIEDLDVMIKAMPSRLQRQLGQLNGAQLWVVLSSTYLMSPMFLIVPLMVSSIIGADSFAGEKERKTLEGLLYTPVSDESLFIGKLLSAMLPAMVIDVGAFALYAIVVNWGGYANMGRLFFPPASWLLLVFWLGPAVALTGLGATVLISSRVKTFMQAQQGAGALVLPIVFLMMAQISGLFFLSSWLVFGLGAGFWVAGLWLCWIGARTFSRSELIARI